MANSNSFTLEIQNTELERLLKTVINSPHKEIIAKSIIGHLNTTTQGLSGLFKAINGIDLETRWKVGMNVLVRVNNLYNSNINKELMLEKNMIHQDYIKAHIISIDLFNYSNINLVYEMINNKGDLEKCTYQVNDQSIIEEECFPGETESEIPF